MIGELIGQFIWLSAGGLTGQFIWLNGGWTWQQRLLSNGVMQGSGGQYPDPIQKLFADLLHVVGPGQMHWRYSLRADAVLLFLLPPTDAQSASLLTQHYLRLVLSQLLSQRSLGLTGLLYLLRQDDDWAQVSFM